MGLSTSYTQSHYHKSCKTLNIVNLTYTRSVHTQPGSRDFNASMNLPARDPTLRTSLLTTTLKCEHRTYEPAHSYPHTRVSLIWTSPLILIMRSITKSRTYPSMILSSISWPRFDISNKQHATKTTKTAIASCAIAWHCLSAARWNSSTDRLIVSSCHQVPLALETSLVHILPNGSNTDR